MHIAIPELLSGFPMGAKMGYAAHIEHGGVAHCIYFLEKLLQSELKYHAHSDIRLLGVD